MSTFSVSRFLFQVAAATTLVLLLTWLAMVATDTALAACRKQLPTYSLRRLFFYMTAIAVMLALATVVLRSLD